MGQIITLAIKVLLMCLQNRFDPEMIKLREVAKIKHAQEKDLEEIERAVAEDDTVAISNIWSGLQPR